MEKSPLRILIVEDEPAHAEAIRRAFQLADPEVMVQTVDTLQGYRQLVAISPPDIAILDWKLPDGAGMEVLASPPEAGPFPILIMTSFGNEQVAVEAIKLGAFDYIVKSPEAFAVIPQTMQRLLREWRLLQERKQADEALRVILERYRHLVENANEAIIVAQDGRLKFVNPMACKITGYSEEELTSIPFADLIHPNDRELIVSFYLSEILLNRYAFRILTKEGATKWVEIGAALIEWEGQPATLNLLTDVTARKQGEEALRKSEAIIRSIFVAAPVGIGVDSNRVILEINDTFCRMTGYSRDELIGQDAKLLYLTTEDYDYVGQEKYRQINGKGIGTIETRLRRKDGEIIHVLISATPIDKKDFTKGVIFTAQDITEQKQNEEALWKSRSMLKNILDTVPQSIFWKDVEGVYAGCNKRFADTVGIEDSDLVVGKTDFDLPWTREKAEAYRLDDQEVMITGKPKSHIIEPLQRGNGKRLWVDTTKIQLVAETGKVFGVLGVYDDISERKQAEEQIVASLKEKEVLLKEIHHRVKNNLAIISSILSLQAQYVQDEKSLEIFRECANRVKTMALIHTNLYQSKDLAQIDFVSYLRDLTDNLFLSYQVDPEAVTLNIQIEDTSFDIETSIPLGLILNELLTNNLKHAFPEGRNGEITISLRKEDSHIVLTVADNGVGFPENIDFTNTPSLGLQLVMALVDQLKGTVKIKRDKGTAFTLTFQEKR